MLFALLQAAVGAARPAAASPPTEEELIKQGVESRRNGNDAAAVELFRRAYESGRSAHALSQVGLAEMALGHWTEAEVHLEQALAAPDPWVAKNTDTLRAALARVRDQLGSLEIVGSPAGAEIVCEGHALGKLPLARPLRLRVGEAQIEVRAPGFVPARRSVRIGPGALVRESVDLARAEEPAPAPAGTAAAVVVAPPPAQSPQPEPTEPARAPAGRGALRTVGLVAGGAGVLGLAVSMAYGLKAMSANNDSNADGHCDATGCDDAGAKLRHDAFDAARTSTALFVAGGVLVAGGVTLYLLGRPGAERRSASAGVTVVPAGGGAGLVIAGGF
jgi:hypothetical protein